MFTLDISKKQIPLAWQPAKKRADLLWRYSEREEVSYSLNTVEVTARPLTTGRLWLWRLFGEALMGY